MADPMRHFTDLDGFNGIRAAPDWKFKAHDPPGQHPKGAYFTLLPPNSPALAARLGISAAKVEYVFKFADKGDLKPIEGGRGKYILYSPVDYVVTRERQHFKGKSKEEK